MNKKTMKQLDRINLLWALKQISLGNLVRGVIFLTKPVEKCATSTVNKVKTVLVEEREKQSATEPKT